MRNIIYFIILLLSLASCGKKSNFTISGKLSGGEGKTVYLSKLLLSSQSGSDSVKLNSQGEFQLKGNCSTPTFYLLKLSKKSFITLLVDSTEQVVISGSYGNFTRDYGVKGSIGSESLRDLDNRFYHAKNQLDSLQKLIEAQKTNLGSITNTETLKTSYNRIVTRHSDYITAFVKNNPFSLVSVYALYQKWNETSYVINDMQAMKVAASALFSVYPKNEQVVALYNNTLQFIKEERAKNLNNVIESNAVNSPNIILPDVDGHKRDLWSLHGKYVLLHFWSAKDRGSRILNPVLSEVYQKFRNRGFEIFMVSVDDDKAAWTEAIAADKLNFINVGDMKGSFQAVSNYNVQELPFNYLLDKQGNIIARNLKGPAINQALSNLLK